MQNSKNKNILTMAQVRALQASGRVVYVYPRKKIVCVDGFKYYRLAEVAR